MLRADDKGRDDPILRGAIEPELVQALDRAVAENEVKEHDESWAAGLPAVGRAHFTEDSIDEHLDPERALPPASNRYHLAFAEVCDPLRELIDHLRFPRRSNIELSECQSVSTSP